MLTGLSMMASSARPDDDDDSTTPSGGGGGGGGGGGDECHCWVSGYCRVLPGYCRVLPGYMKGPPVGHRWRRCSDRGRGRGPMAEVQRPGAGAGAEVAVAAGGYLFRPDLLCGCPGLAPHFLFTFSKGGSLVVLSSVYENIYPKKAARPREQGRRHAHCGSCLAWRRRAAWHGVGRISL